MSGRGENPFEKYDLDPMEGPRSITDRLRELSEDAGEEERAEIRAAWEELTLHPLRRLRAALFASPRHPDADKTSPDQAPLAGLRPPQREPFTLADLAPRPSVLAALEPFLSTSKDVRTKDPESLDADPVLGTTSANPPKTAAKARR